MERDKNDAYFVFLPRFPLTIELSEKRESILELQLELLHTVKLDDTAFAWWNGPTNVSLTNDLSKKYL